MPNTHPLSPRKRRLTRLMCEFAELSGFGLPKRIFRCLSWSSSYRFHETPMERLHQREFERYGGLIMAGGDMYEQSQQFLAWAVSYDDGCLDMRSRRMHEQWLSMLPWEEEVETQRPLSGHR